MDSEKKWKVCPIKVPLFMLKKSMQSQKFFLEYDFTTFLIIHTVWISENLEPLPLEPLTFISTTPATLKRDPVPINNPIPPMVTKMPLAKMKIYKKGIPTNFFRYNVPVQNLADSIIKRQRPVYQQGPNQGTL